MTDHPIQGVLDAIARSWAKAERSGHYPVREIDLLRALHEDEGVIAMALELKEAREKTRVHWVWRWLAAALFLALVAETIFLLTR